jgi:hypothetical protein
MVHRKAAKAGSLYYSLGRETSRHDESVFVVVRVVKGIGGARAATGVVVVIDVLRAFTTAAYAFRAGLAEIELVSTVDEALAAEGFRTGEVGGRLIPGFDHNNSPSQLVGRHLAGRGIRTGFRQSVCCRSNGCE